MTPETNAALSALKETSEFLDGIQEGLTCNRSADWYPEGANNAALAMSEAMRVIANMIADFGTVQNAIALLSASQREESAARSDELLTECAGLLTIDAEARDEEWESDRREAVKKWGIYLDSPPQREAPVAEGVDGLAHELWAMAQLAPGEGIEDGVARIARRLAERPSVTNVSRDAIWWKICQTMPELSESRRQAATDAILALQLPTHQGTILEPVRPPTSTASTDAPAPVKAADEERLKNYEAILRFLGAPDQIVMGQVSIVHPEESEMEEITREYLDGLKGVK